MEHTFQEHPGLSPRQEEQVRAIVREEIVKAFGAFRRETEGYDGGEIRDIAADALSTMLDGTVVRLTCPHEKYWDWGQQPQCARCGEPEPEPVNPFEPEPVNPFEPDPSCDHAYDLETSPDCLLCGSPYPRRKTDG